MSLIVVKPNSSHRQAFLRMLDDYLMNDPDNVGGYALAATNFEKYLRSLEDEETGFNLLPGIVAGSHRWLLDSAGEIVAVVRTRYTIDTPFLNSVGGHIGYDVAPSQRGKRYSIAALSAGLDEARRVGLDRVMVCADAENTRSCRTIERCGGVLEMEFLSEHWPIPVRRYWFELSGTSDAPNVQSHHR
ncbi:MAG: GNAT family N-acetyltransferase [Armatimonadetes bacterium]|nr:GNAT family N-acetyltransferase [Armatimonadota bacterium]